MGFLGEMHDDLRRYLEAPRWFQNRAPSPLARRRLLLPRVRHRRGPAPVLRRPGRARRRSPEGGQQPGYTPHRRGAHVPPGLLPPASRYRRVAGGALPGPGSARDGAGAGRRGAGLGRPGRRDLWRPRCGGLGSAGSSSTCSTPMSTATMTSCGRSPTACTGAGRSTGCVRRSSSASVGCGPSQAHGRRVSGVPHQRGPCRVPGLRADPQAHHGGGAGVGRSDRGGPGRDRLHHPHARARPGSTAFPAS